MLKRAAIFILISIVIWIVGVMVVYALVATGNGDWLEIVFKALFIGVPVAAGSILVRYHNARAGGKVSWKDAGLIFLLVAPILVLVSGFLAPALGYAMLGFMAMPDATIFGLVPDVTIDIVGGCVVGLLFFHRRVNLAHKG